jgi:hypothetical protein
MFFCCQQELVHRVEGFKHVSWKKDKEVDDISNFKFTVAELSKQNVCLEGIINTEAVSEPVVDFSEGSVSTVNSQVPELSDGGDIKQYGNSCLDMTFEGATLKVSSANGTVVGPDSKSGVAGSNTDLCVPFKIFSDDDVPGGQVSEAQRPKDKIAECCEIVKDINFLEYNKENIAPDFVMPLKVDCNITVPNGCRATDMELTSASSASESTLYRMAQRFKRYWHHMTGVLRDTTQRCY